MSVKVPARQIMAHPLTRGARKRRDPMPAADRQTRAVATMSGWDAPMTDRRAAKDRAGAYLGRTIR